MKSIQPLVLAFVLLISSSACKKNEGTVETLSKTGDTYELGLVLPELRAVVNDTARVVLYPHARWFYLDMKMKRSQTYLRMIEDAGKSGRHVKARIFKRMVGTGGEEIAEIY